VAREAERLRATPAQVAIAWLLGKSPVMLPIPGTSAVAHLEENTAAAKLVVDHETMEALDLQAAPV
jgi:aryl-alcohol dehydrogenase-like predicted oxidoreductase